MNGNLQDVLDGNQAPEVAETPAVEAAPEVVETGEIEQVEATPETAQAPAAEVTPTPEPKSESVPMAALLAERRKRQELESRLAEKAATPQVPEFFSDPENHVRGVVRQQALAMSAAMVEQQYPDFREVAQTFLEEAGRNPILQQQLEEHAHPALFAYQQGKQIGEFRKMQDLPTFKAQMRAELEAEIRAQIAAETGKKQSLAANLPPDLATARSTRAPEPVLHDSLDSILKKKAK